MVQWGKIWGEAGKRSGYPFDLVENNRMEEGMKAAGFTNIVSKDYPVSYQLYFPSVLDPSPPYSELRAARFRGFPESRSCRKHGQGTSTVQGFTSLY